MKFKIGDKVKFLNDIGEGIITKIVSESMVNVEIEDGFEVPTKISELLKFNESLHPDMEEEELIELEKEVLDDKIEEEVEAIFNKDSEEYVLGNDKPHILLALLPKYQASTFVESVELYLINDSNLKALYSISHTNDDKRKHIDSGVLEANTKICFLTYNHKDIRKTITLNIQALHYTAREYNIIPPIDKDVKLDSLRIIDPNEFTENEYFEEKALLFDFQSDEELKELENIDVNKLEKAKDEKEAKPVKVDYKNSTTEIQEVDLHIEEIVDNHSSLNNSEILEIQMSRFKIALDGALINNARRIVFIHGVGNGTLRYEIRKYIDNHYPKLRYQDASYKEYGYGATMVLIK